MNLAKSMCSCNQEICLCQQRLFPRENSGQERCKEAVWSWKWGLGAKSAVNAGAQRSKEREAQLARKDDLTHFKPRKATTILVKVLSNQSHGNYSSPTILASRLGQIPNFYKNFVLGAPLTPRDMKPFTATLGLVWNALLGLIERILLS